MDHPIPKEPGFFLLHHNELPHKTHKNLVLIHLVNVSRSCIPALYKSSSPPTVGQFFSRKIDIKHMDNMTRFLKAMTNTFLNVWFHCKDFFYSYDYSHILADSSTSSSESPWYNLNVYRSSPICCLSAYKPINLPNWTRDLNYSPTPNPPFFPFKPPPPPLCYLTPFIFFL